MLIYHIKNEDALLVSQNNELDLVQMKKLNDVEELIKNKYKQLIHFNIYDFITQHFSLLSLYLNQQELINLMLVNKQFFKQVKYNLISELEKHKQKYEQKINEYKDEIIDDPGTPILKPSRGTTKATDLLNGPPLNKIFTEGNKIPNNDILRIYCLYFQIIKHKNAKNYPLNKELFWENACNYFTKEHEGKTGQLLAKNIKEDVDLSNEKSYKMLRSGLEQYAKEIGDEIPQKIIEEIEYFNMILTDNFMEKSKQKFKNKPFRRWRL